MKIAELRNLSVAELTQKEQDLKKELFKLNYQRRMGRVEKPHLFKQAKRGIARIKTLLQERSTSNIKVEETKNAEDKK